MPVGVYGTRAYAYTGAYGVYTCVFPGMATGTPTSAAVLMPAGSLGTPRTSAGEKCSPG